MEPRQNEVVPSVEQAHPVADYGEGLVTQNPERAHDARVEKAPEVGQVQAEISQIAMPSLPTPVLTNSNATATQGQGDDTTPLAANDDDLIEKEWVEKAKSIIAATKDDPFKREREISKLQIEYIRKRYGRVIGDSGD